MEDTGKAKFFAFISHKSKDRQFALKLQKFIESYHLPTKVRKQTNAPKNLSPLCAYEVDFSAKPLYDEMREKLRQSKYLILLCSHDEIEGGSPYVNYEIETFIAFRREEGIDPATRIIPIALNEPPYASVDECCPSALMALGINRPIILERKKYKSDREVFLHAISAMLDIDYAVLVDRDKKRRLRKGCLAAAALLAAAVAVGAALNYLLPHRSHYVDFVLQNGVPVGIGSLQPWEYNKMAAHYVLTTQRGRITEVSYVNPQGKLIDHTGWENGDRPARYVFDYTSQGISTVTYYNRNANPYFVLSYMGGSLHFADFLEGTDEYGVHYIPQGYTKNLNALLGDYSVSTPIGISRFVYEYDANGFVTQITFRADSSGKWAEDSGVYGLQYERDSLGRIRKTYYIDQDGQRIPNAEGIYCKEYLYDSQYNLTELKNYDAAGDLVEDSDGVVHLRRTYSGHNIIRLELLDGKGKPMVVTSYGGATIELSLNAYGQTAEVHIYDEQGKPYALEGYYGMRNFYDANGFLSGYTYLDEQFNPFFCEEEGYATLHCTRDAIGNETSYRYTDLSGELVENHSGYAYAEVTYNQRGQATEYVYYDATGELADCKGYGYSIKVQEYDSLGRATAVYHLDQNREPVNIQGPSYEYGYYKMQTDYAYGLLKKVTVSYFDKDGHLVNSQSAALGPSYARAEIVYQDGFLTSAIYYDQNGKQYGERYEQIRTRTPQGEVESVEQWIDENEAPVNRITSRYGIDQARKSERVEYYLEDGLRVILRSFDERGETTVLTDTYYDLQNQLKEQYRNEYDENGNVVYIETVTPMNPDYGIFRQWNTYSDGVKTIERMEMYQTEEQLTAKIESHYDADGRKIWEEYQQYQDGQPDGKILMETVYQADQSYTVTMKLYDAADELLHELTEHYNSDGELLE